MKAPLLWKFLAINIAVIAVTVFVVWMAIDYLAADYYAALMRGYNIAPRDSHRMFLDAAHRVLIQASLLALAFAGVLSFVLNRRLLRPVAQLSEATRQIAVGNYAVTLDVTSRDEFGDLANAFRHMAESLEKLERFREKTMIDVAHGLRTPLTNMRGYLEALRSNVLPPSKETFDTLHDETMRLVKLVESLLSLARADVAGVTIRHQNIDLGELILQVYELFQLKFEAKDIQITSEFCAAGQIMADPEMLWQVISNLLDNACQYTPHGGRISIRAETVPRGVRVSVTNTGDGIAAAELPFIFDRFFHRGEQSRASEYGGAGVGLTIVKELVEAHDGSVGAHSTPLETTIWFILPK